MSSTENEIDSTSAGIEGGEKIIIDGCESPDNSQEDNVVFDISTHPADLTLTVVDMMWKSGDFIIPPYQRSFVWSQKQASLLIESFLLGLPVPPAFLYLNEDGVNEIIDGQQRIRSICMYISGFFGDENDQEKKTVFRLKGLSEKSPFFDKRYSDLDDKEKRKLNNSILRCMVVRQLHPTHVNPLSVYYIFERLNTGGTPLSPQEIRNCVCSGPFVDKLRKLNNDVNWRKILGSQKLLANDRDVEIILRVYALTVFSRNTTYAKPMKSYLTKAMMSQKKKLDISTEEFISSWPKACQAVIRNLGDKPFHKIGSRLNLSVLDAVMSTFVTQEISASTSVEDLPKKFDNLTKNEEFLKSVKFNTSDEREVETRRALAKKYLFATEVAGQ